MYVIRKGAEAARELNRLIGKLSILAFRFIAAVVENKVAVAKFIEAKFYDTY